MGSLSRSPTCRPSSSRGPSALTPVVSTTAREQTCSFFVQPPVKVGGFEVELRAWSYVQGPLQERLDLAIKSLADAAHLRAEMPACQPIAATRASPLRVEMPFTQAFMNTS